MAHNLTYLYILCIITRRLCLLSLDIGAWTKGLHNYGGW